MHSIRFLMRHSIAMVHRYKFSNPNKIAIQQASAAFLAKHGRRNTEERSISQGSKKRANAEMVDNRYVQQRTQQKAYIYIKKNAQTRKDVARNSHQLNIFIAKQTGHVSPHHHQLKPTLYFFIPLFILFFFFHFLPLSSSTNPKRSSLIHGHVTI